MPLLEPLSVGVDPFVPDNFPSREHITAMVEAELDHIGDGEPSRCLAGAIGNVTADILPAYVSKHSDLEVVLDRGAGNCFAFTAIAGLVGHFYGRGTTIPVVRTDCSLSKGGELSKQYHALPVVHDGDGTIPIAVDRIINSGEPSRVPLVRGHSVSYGSMYVNHYNNELEDTEGGVFQVRAGNAVDEIYTGEDTRLKHFRPRIGHYINETAFIGEVGLESFLATYEFLLALKEKRRPDISPSQLIPRL